MVYLNYMQNKIVPGPFVDKMISTYLKIESKSYSTKATDALILLSKFTLETSSSFTINYENHLNYQSCKVTLNFRNNNYTAESGYLPMTICLLFINSWSKPLKFYSFEFLKIKYEKYKELQLRIDEEGWTNENCNEQTELDLHPDIP